MGDPVLLSYLAGCIDCDGSINVLRNNRIRVDGTPVLALIVRLTFTQVNPEGPRLFQATFGGNLYYYDAPKRENGWWQWYVAGANAAAAIRALRPFLRSKGEQADLACELADLMQAHRLTRNGQRVDEVETAKRLELADRIRAHNVRRPKAAVRGKQHAGTPS